MNMITSEITRAIDVTVHTREMTRNNFNNLKEYLVENLSFYRNVFEAIDYVIDHEISQDEFRQMCRSFDDKYPDKPREVQDLYVVTQDYLKMDPVKLCDLIVFNRKN